MSLARIVITLLSVYLIIRVFQWLRKRRRLVEAIDKLPGPPNVPYTPIINHALVILYLDYLKHRLGTFFLVYHVISNIQRLFPEEGICRFWLGLKPFVVLYAPETVESVLVSTSVINKSDEYRFFEPWIGEGLVTSRKSKWRFRRKILTPAFHFRILNDFLPIMNKEASKLVRKLNQAKYLNPSQPFDITPLITLCTLDTICETAMGVNINSQDDEHSSYVESLRVVGETALSRVTRPWLWPDFIFYWTQSGRRFVKATDSMHEFTTKVILDRRAEWARLLGIQSSHEERDSHKQTQGDTNRREEKKVMSFEDLRVSKFFSPSSGKTRQLAFLDLMLHQHLIERTISIDDIREEVDTFMFAGHDTTAMSISWTLYMLGLHEDIQDRVRDELSSVLGVNEFSDIKDGHEENQVRLAKYLKVDDINIEQLREMKYLDRVIKESLRMWPSIPFVARQVTEDILVANKYLVPEGSTCMIFTHALHMNPMIFEKPELFDPDRFLPEKCLKRHPFAYIPFSAGPRNCIGQKFAIMEVKIILAKVLLNYRIKTHNHRDKLAIVGELVLRSSNGLNVTLEPRFV